MLTFEHILESRPHAVSYATTAVFKLYEDTTLKVLSATADNLGISFAAYASTIKNIVADIYADGVFLMSTNQLSGGIDVPSAGLSRLDVNAATTYILSKCKARGIPSFFVQTPITRVVSAIYAANMSFIVGPGKLMSSMGR